MKIGEETGFYRVFWRERQAVENGKVVASETYPIAMPVIAGAIKTILNSGIELVDGSFIPYTAFDYALKIVEKPKETNKP